MLMMDWSVFVAKRCHSYKCRNGQYTYIYRRTIEIPRRPGIFKVNYGLNVPNIHLKFRDKMNALKEGWLYENISFYFFKDLK